MRRLKLHAIVTAGVMFACTPALDWREVRAEGGAMALFPCKPTRQTRSTSLAGAKVPMTLASCTADGMTFALSQADMGGAAGVAAALADLQSALAGNVGAREVLSAAFELRGTQSKPPAVRLSLRGRLPDGTLVHEQAVSFGHGTQVYLAVVLGARLDEGAAAVFFESLRLPS